MSKSSKGARAMRLSRLLGRLLSRATLWGLLLSILASLVILIVLPRATQGSALTVVTGSMTPEIPVGSIAFVRPVDPATLKLGDVATYQRQADPDVFITHRVVGIDPSSNPTTFTFKGDANRGEDAEPVPATAIRGEVWFHVPYLGAIRDALNGKAGLSLLAMLVLGGYALAQLGSAVRDRRGRHPEGEQPAEQKLVCDQTVLVADLKHDGDPFAVARAFGGVVLTRSTGEFTALITTPSDAASTLAQELTLFGATEVCVFDQPALLRVSSNPLVRIGEERAPRGDRVHS